MLKHLATTAFAATALAFAFATPASATPFAGSFTVSAHNTDPGLIINTTPGPGFPGGNINVNVAINGPATALNNLFLISTPESTVNVGEDTVPYPISVAFNFTAPTPPFGGSANGDTFGVSQLFGIIQYGVVDWNGPLVIETGFGTVTITLDDTQFSEGLFGLSGSAAPVNGTISAVPEPASLALLGLGLVGLGLTRRRKTV